MALFIWCTDCHCSKDVIPAIKRVFKQLKEFYSQDKNPPENWDNKQYALFGEFILVLPATLITCILHFLKTLLYLISIVSSVWFVTLIIVLLL